MKRRRTRLASVTGALVAALVLAGCWRSTPPPATARPVVHIAGATTIPFEPSRNARADVTTTACAPVAGSWVVSGTVRNTAAQPRTFQIVVDFVAQPGNTILDTKIVYVDGLAPAITKPWWASGAAGQDHVACLVRQVQAS